MPGWSLKFYYSQSVSGTTEMQLRAREALRFIRFFPSSDRVFWISPQRRGMALRIAPNANVSYFL